MPVKQAENRSVLQLSSELLRARWNTSCRRANRTPDVEVPSSDDILAEVSTQKESIQSPFQVGGNHSAGEKEGED